MFKLLPFSAAKGTGRRLANFASSPWLLGEGDEARFADTLANSGAAWHRITHKIGWFKKFHMLQAKPAEMIVVQSFLQDAHRTLGADKLVVGLPSRDAIIAADHAQLARLMVITTLRYTEVAEPEKLSPDLFIVEQGKIVAMALNTLLEQEIPAAAEVKRVLLVGGCGEFHIVAGRDPQSLLDLVDKFVSFASEKWVSDPKFTGECVMFVKAPETMQPMLDELAASLTAAVETSGCRDRLRFRVEHTLC